MTPPRRELTVRSIVFFIVIFLRVVTVNHHWLQFTNPPAPAKTITCLSLFEHKACRVGNRAPEFGDLRSCHPGTNDPKAGEPVVSRSLEIFGNLWTTNSLPSRSTGIWS